MIKNNLKRKLLKVMTGTVVSSCMIFGAFEGNVISNLSGIEVVKASNDNLYTEDGFWYVIVDNSYAQITGYFGSEDDVVIPEKIDGYEVRSIGLEAFSEVDWDFDDDDSNRIRSVKIPSTVKTIEQSAFSYCKKLENIEMSEGIEKIGPSVFVGCSSLKSINIPSSVSVMGDKIFYNTELENITVGENNKKYDSRDNCNAIIETATNKLVTGCCNTVIPSSVTSIGKSAFFEQNKLTNISIPSSVKIIEEAAFESCKELNSVEIADGLTSIGTDAFVNCEKLTNIAIPSSVTVIGEKAFASCDGLSKVELSDGLTKIDKEAFYSCDSLKSIYIPSTVNVIGAYAFCNTGLVSISVSAENETYDSRNNCNAIIRTATNDLVCGCIKTKIPSDVKSISDGAFKECDITNISIPSGVNKIGQDAFACSSLKSVTIASGVKEIGEGAFYGTLLTNVTIPSSVKSIGVAAFNYCGDLKNVTISDGVTSIGEDAFSGTSLTSIIIPSSVKSIGVGAFADCSKLKNVTISNGVTSIGRDAFCYCESLTSVIIPSSVTSIGKYAFAANGESFKIKCYKNSYAHKYAVKNNIKYEIYQKNNKITATTTYNKTASAKSQSFKLDAKAKGGKLKYKSNNKSIKVDSKGKVTIAKNFSGKAVITVTAGNDEYKTVTKKITITVKPAATTLKSVKNSTAKKASKGKITVAWKKLSYVTGYQIQYSTTPKFKSGTNKLVNVKNASKTNATVKGLAKNKTYYVRIRTYRIVAGKNLYSAWSAKKTVKIGK